MSLLLLFPGVKVEEVGLGHEEKAFDAAFRDDEDLMDIITMLAQAGIL